MYFENYGCICGDNRGTDCDYCAGLYREGRKKIIDTTPLLSPFVDIDVVSNKNVQTKLLLEEQKIFNRLRSKSFDGQILELKLAIEEIDLNSLPATIQYLKDKIYHLNERVFSLESKVTKKQRNHYNRTKVESLLLIEKFKLKFEHSKEKNITVTDKKYSKSTLKEAFGDLFDLLKKKLEK
jgi:hypothetical protein